VRSDRSIAAPGDLLLRHYNDQTIDMFICAAVAKQAVQIIVADFFSERANTLSIKSEIMSEAGIVNLTCLE